jgi:hypothetical protein
MSISPQHYRILAAINLLKDKVDCSVNKVTVSLKTNTLLKKLKPLNFAGMHSCWKILYLLFDSALTY